jgi:hypothetical protein
MNADKRGWERLGFIGVDRRLSAANKVSWKTEIFEPLRKRAERSLVLVEKHFWPRMNADKRGWEKTWFYRR